MGFRRQLLVAVAVFFAASTVAMGKPQQATRLPETYVQLRQQLAASCGDARAAAIANLVWDTDIHKTYAGAVKNNPDEAKRVGDADWHNYWISVYQHTIALLTKDCRAPAASRR